MAIFVSLKCLGWAGYKATSSFLCPIVHIQCHFSVVYTSRVSSVHEWPERTLWPAGSPKWAHSAFFAAPFSSISTRAKQAWLLNNTMCHLNNAFHWGKHAKYDIPRSHKAAVLASQCQSAALLVLMVGEEWRVIILQNAWSLQKQEVVTSWHPEAAWNCCGRHMSYKE